MKKNNKVLLNMNTLTLTESTYVKSNIHDVLRNLEVIYIGSREMLKQEWTEGLNNWNGNILVRE